MEGDIRDFVRRQRLVENRGITYSAERGVMERSIKREI